MSGCHTNTRRHLHCSGVIPTPAVSYSVRVSYQHLSSAPGCCPNNRLYLQCPCVIIYQHSSSATVSVCHPNTRRHLHCPCVAPTPALSYSVVQTLAVICSVYSLKHLLLATVSSKHSQSAAVFIFLNISYQLQCPCVVPINTRRQLQSRPNTAVN